MFFFPYRANFPLLQVPVWSILIVLLCAFVYYLQVSAFNLRKAETLDYCERNTNRSASLLLRNLYGTDSAEACAHMLANVHARKDKAGAKQLIVDEARPIRSMTRDQSDAFYKRTIDALYKNYQYTVPDDLTSSLSYDPASWDIAKMLSSIFTHGDLGHLTGNLFFFIAFSFALESLLGYILYPIAFLSLAAMTNVFYSLYASSVENVLPTIGLSGVVMGVVAMLVFFIPKVKIRWLLFIFFFIRRPEFPAWLVALFYIGTDTFYFYSNKDVGNINLVVHIVGGASGYLLGFLFLRGKRDRILDELEYAGSYDSGDLKRQRRARSQHMKEISREERRKG